MTLTLSDAFFGIAAVLFVIESARDKSLASAAMALVAIGLILAL